MCFLHSPFKQIQHIQRLSLYNWYNQSIGINTSISFKLQSSYTTTASSIIRSHTTPSFYNKQYDSIKHIHTNYNSFKQKDKYSSHRKLHTYKQCPITGTWIFNITQQQRCPIIGTYTQLKIYTLKALLHTKIVHKNITLKCLIQRHTHTKHPLKRVRNEYETPLSIRWSFCPNLHRFNR